MNTSAIQTYFRDEIIAIEPHSGVLTNDNYIVTTKQNRYFFRQPKEQLAEFFDRHLEAKVLKMVAPLNIDLPYCYFDENSGIKISRYYPDLLNFAQYQKPQRLALVASTLKKLHSLNRLCGSKFDYHRQLNLYQKAIAEYPFDLAPFRVLLGDLAEYQADLTLCHNDCVNGNLLFATQRNYLIDYEYAGDNYPIFDVTSFTTENDLNALERGEFYRLYYGPATEQLTADLVLFEKLHHYLWCHWALMMLAKEKAPVYWDIAKTKYENLSNYQAFIL